MPVSIPAAFIVSMWLICLHLRQRFKDRLGQAPAYAFNLVQAALVILTAVAIGALIFAVQQGLLGHPDMQISGNGSYSGHLAWYQDRAEAVPQAWFVSLPLWAYRCAMLLWALWLSFSLIKWLAWGWQAFSTEGAWKKTRPIKAGRVWIKGRDGSSDDPAGGGQGGKKGVSDRDRGQEG